MLTGKPIGPLARIFHSHTVKSKQVPETSHTAVLRLVIGLSHVRVKNPN